MKLLICTQVVDKTHPALGFFHRWLEEFAQHCSSVQVICLEEGEHQLPAHVHIHSLGKEQQRSTTFLYTLKLIWLSYKLRGAYTHVFVHMNPEYVLAGSPVWMLLRKPIYLWYTHGAVTRNLRLALMMVKNVFTAAQIGSNLTSKKIIVTGHGIEMVHETESHESRTLDLITVGRITRSKNLESLVAVLAKVCAVKKDTTLTIIGAATTADEKQYQRDVADLTIRHGVQDRVHFVGAVPHAEIVDWIGRAKVFVHAATNGSLDKVLLEAIVAGTPVVSSATGAGALPLGEWHVACEADFVQQVLTLVTASASEKMALLRDHVATKHSLQSLIERLVNTMVT